MSNGLLREIYDHKGFKPAPSLWELGGAHVPFGDLGLAPAPEPIVTGGMVEADGLVMLVGRSGAGKSSVLAAVAKDLATRRTQAGNTYLPIFVPVAGRPHAIDLDAFGRAAMREIVLALRASLPEELRDRLVQATSAEISIQERGQKFNAKMTGQVFGAGPEAGFELGGAVTTVITSGVADNRGGVTTLADVCRAHGTELVVIVEDTDAWARGGTDVAQRFFTNVARPLTDAEIAVGVAVQSGWLEGEGDALAEAHDLRERAVAVAEVPEARTDAQAATVIRAVLNRRVLRAVDRPQELSASPVDELFTDDALLLLAGELRMTGSVRTPLARVRDALDRHGEELPERLDAIHLLDAS